MVLAQRHSSTSSPNGDAPSRGVSRAASMPLNAMTASVIFGATAAAATTTRKSGRKPVHRTTSLDQDSFLRMEGGAFKSRRRNNHHHQETFHHSFSSGQRLSIDDMVAKNNAAADRFFRNEMEDDGPSLAANSKVSKSSKSSKRSGKSLSLDEAFDQEELRMILMDASKDMKILAGTEQDASTIEDPHSSVAGNFNHERPSQHSSSPSQKKSSSSHKRKSGFGSSAAANLRSKSMDHVANMASALDMTYNPYNDDPHAEDNDEDIQTKFHTSFAGDEEWWDDGTSGENSVVNILREKKRKPVRQAQNLLNDMMEDSKSDDYQRPNPEISTDSTTSSPVEDNLTDSRKRPNDTHRESDQKTSTKPDETPSPRQSLEVMMQTFHDRRPDDEEQLHSLDAASFNYDEALSVVRENEHENDPSSHHQSSHHRRVIRPTTSSGDISLEETDHTNNTSARKSRTTLEGLDNQDGNIVFNGAGAASSGQENPITKEIEWVAPKCVGNRSISNLSQNSGLLAPFEESMAMPAGSVLVSPPSRPFTPLAPPSAASSAPASPNSQKQPQTPVQPSSGSAIASGPATPSYATDRCSLAEKQKKKRIIKVRGGENVNPEKIQQALKKAVIRKKESPKSNSIPTASLSSTSTTVRTSHRTVNAIPDASVGNLPDYDEAVDVKRRARSQSRSRREPSSSSSMLSNLDAEKRRARSASRVRKPLDPELDKAGNNSSSSLSTAIRRERSTSRVRKSNEGDIVASAGNASMSSLGSAKRRSRSESRAKQFDNPESSPSRNERSRTPVHKQPTELSSVEKRGRGNVQSRETAGNQSVSTEAKIHRSDRSKSRTRQSSSAVTPSSTERKPAKKDDVGVTERKPAKKDDAGGAASERKRPRSKSSSAVLRMPALNSVESGSSGTSQSPPRSTRQLVENICMSPIRALGSAIHRASSRKNLNSNLHGDVQGDVPAPVKQTENGRSRSVNKKRPIPSASQSVGEIPVSQDKSPKSRKSPKSALRRPMSAPPRSRQSRMLRSTPELPAPPLSPKRVGSAVANRLNSPSHIGPDTQVKTGGNDCTNGQGSHYLDSRNKLGKNASAKRAPRADDMTAKLELVGITHDQIAHLSRLGLEIVFKDS